MVLILYVDEDRALETGSSLSKVSWHSGFVGQEEYRFPISQCTLLG